MEEALDMERICRVCLCESPEMYSIFSELLSEDRTEDERTTCIFEILMNISSMKIQPNDGLPAIICIKCLDSAHNSFKFQQQCNQSQALLEEYVQNCSSSKTETSRLIDTSQIQEELSPCEESVFFPTDCLAPSTEDDSGIKTPGKTSETISDEEDSECVDPLEINNSNLTKDLLEIAAADKGTCCIVQSDGTKLYSCKICARCYKHPSSLNAHIKNHELELDPNECNICGKKFTKYSSYLYHMKSHTGIRTHVCKLCGKSYKQSSTLIAHMRVHTGQRPFLCSICGKGFRQAADLGYHMRTHTKERPYMCNVCGKTMAMQSHLVQHMRTHTGERPFECSTCEKRFISTSALKRHSLIHTDAKPYSCEVCSKSFNRRGTLKVHAKTHTDERPHVCNICSKGFIQLRALKTHLSIHLSEIANEMTD